ncbi:contactin-like [Portunus trituberculatus]|uniref:contactin-like n=1 Tax=Portunus trituberculatus TaxID=210409 RepID=UPI001E1D0DF1|nr:contactin-like [Portunus trituberculatus]XP_045114343.1 contactin-like [Portunus trituberculatus]XP_045114344.1 contactin-like [Portunus trituberculatus]
MELWALVIVATVVVAAGRAQMLQNNLLVDPLLENTVEKTCPTNWSTHRGSCYKYIRSPVKTRQQARAQCQAYGEGSDLVSVSNKEEHGFLTRYLHENDPLQRKWYTAGYQKTPGFWENEGDGSSYQDMTEAFLPEQAISPQNNYLAYSYSVMHKEWGLLMVDGEEALLYVCEIPQANINNIIDESVERDHEYGLVIEDPTKVPQGPVFDLQPVDKIFDLARREVINYISVTCLAKGYPPPTYTWYKESYENEAIRSRPIDPLQDPRFTVSGGTLIINNPKQVEDRGKYHCRAENKFGSITSESIQLSFAYVAEFNLKRSDEIGNQYWGKAIYCDPPQHFPDVRYYWARTFFPNLVEEDRRTMVSHDGNLYFSYVDMIDNGLYSCNVMSTVSGIGKNGPFFNLDVLPHPNYQQLKFANNFPKAFPEAPIRGEDVRLECIVFGYPVPSYNWTRRGGALPRGAQLLSYNRVLLLPKVEPSDMGDYVCRAHNTKVAIENSIALSIQAKPSFTIRLQDQFIAKDADLMWECESFGIPDVDYAWLRNSEPLNMETLNEEEKERYEIADSIFKIKGVKESDEAVYQCMATNQLGTSYSSAQLKVLKLAPTFRKKPLETEMYGAEGKNVTIACNPEAAPKPKFTWRQNGLIIGNGGRRKILRNGNLVIDPVSREDRGNYSCTAENIYGSDTSFGWLEVLRKPEFYRSPPEEVITAKGDNITLECEAYIDPLLDKSYVWRHNGLRIELDDTEYLRHLAYMQGYDYEYQSRRYNLYDNPYESSLYLKRREQEMYIAKRYPPYKKGLRAGHLRIPNIQMEDAGVYECVAMTPVAKISISTKIIVHGPPGPPGGVTAVDLTSTRGRVKWTNGASNGRPILSYNIQTRTQWTRKWRTVAENIQAELIDNTNGRMEYQLGDVLSPWSAHEFRVQAVNILGEGQYSSSSPQANTRPDSPFTIPNNLGGGGGKTGDLTITWEPMSGEHQNAPGIYYKLFWRRSVLDPETEFQKVVLRERGNVGMHVVDVNPIKYFYTEYEVKIQAWNSIGPGPISEPVTIYTAEDMPQVQPTEVSAFAHNATSLNVTWQPIEPTRENIRGKLVGYRIKYWRRMDNDTDHIIKLQRGTEPHGLIVGLVPNTFYWVRVMAYNQAGSGPESERFLERTWRHPPLMPPNAVQVYPINPSTIRVTWRGVTPTPMEEPLIGYKVKVWESDQDFTTANDTFVYIGSPLEAYITDLSPGKSYMLRVLAFSRGGDGKKSSPPWKFQMGDTDLLKGSAPGTSPDLLLNSTLLVTFLVGVLTPILRSRFLNHHHHQQ